MSVLIHIHILLVVVTLFISPSLQCNGKKPKSGIEIQSEAAKQDRLQELKLWCAENCATDWQPWDSCSEPCGGGDQVRTRGLAGHDWCSAYTCALSRRETRPCNEDCPNAGYPTGGACSCPNTRGGKCCEIELTCDYPGRPSHGSVEGTWPAMVQSTAFYDCNEGFQLDGDEAQTCSKNLTTGLAYWTGEKPECVELRCAQPSLQANVVLLNIKDMYAFGESILTVCADGYDLIGSDIRECVESPTGARFSGSDAVCRVKRCEDPGVPVNGQREGDDLIYQSQISFTCDAGYKRIGSTSIRCLASGRWLGNVPTCEQIECEEPYEIEHSTVRVRRRGASEIIAKYTCKEGFEIIGESEMTCDPYGYWQGEVPECGAIDCGDPGAPENGFGNSNRFTHPSNITFQCQPGHTLQGSATITCLQTGVWSTTIPQCLACEHNHYELNGACMPCQPNSHTVTEGSVAKELCLCDEGYNGEPGQECIQIRCSELTAPENGVMTDCDNTYQGKCRFTCSDGYIMERGSAVRTCQVSGWDGTLAFCAPCPVDAYKEAESQCNPCPTHSHTDGPAQMLDGCMCDDGYQGDDGGPCTDVDECSDGRGPCEDACQNSIGAYICLCNIPGYKNDPANEHLCLPEFQCQNLTIDDAPENGGVVCHWYQQLNSQFCALRCNPHFDLPDRANDYETCGPSTNFEWSYKVTDPTAVMPPCIKEFFPGIRLQADLFYFTSQCDQMSETEIEATKQAFADVLNENEVCQRDDRQLCEIKDMGIICGRVTRRRRRRGVDEVLQSVDIGFNVTALAPITSPDDCDLEVCRFLGLPDAHCDRYCITAYNRFQRAAIQYADVNLGTMFSSATERAKMIVNTPNRVFEPAGEDSLQSSGVLAECDPGMQFNGENCFPCPPGMYLNKDNVTCIACPVGKYQDTEGQEQCEPCALGLYAPESSMVNCIVCPRGYYGEGCVSRCSCSNGNCDPFVGRCTCLPGWTGDNCDIDKNGCEQAQCAAGVTCHDNPAPEEGYRCGACPDGYQGDGTQCTAVGNALIHTERSSLAAHILF